MQLANVSISRYSQNITVASIERVGWGMRELTIYPNDIVIDANGVVRAFSLVPAGDTEPHLYLLCPTQQDVKNTTGIVITNALASAGLALLGSQIVQNAPQGKNKEVQASVWVGNFLAGKVIKSFTDSMFTEKKTTWGYHDVETGILTYKGRFNKFGRLL
jgi:hypothetical protein